MPCGIIRCEFEKHEPVRNVTALALLRYVSEHYACWRVEHLTASDVDDAVPPRMGDGDILWSVEERDDDIVFSFADRGTLAPAGVRSFVDDAVADFLRHGVDDVLVNEMIGEAVDSLFSGVRMHKEWTLNTFFERLCVRGPGGSKSTKLHPAVVGLLDCMNLASLIETLADNRNSYRETFLELIEQDSLGYYVGAFVAESEYARDDYTVLYELTLPEDRSLPYLLLDRLTSECLRVLRIANRTNTLERRYGWRRGWLPFPGAWVMPYPEWRVFLDDPTKPAFQYESMRAQEKERMV